MLNPSFPKSVCDTLTSPYVAPDSIVNRTIFGNESNNTGPETRLHPAYGEEIWLKLEHAGFTASVLNELSVLEVCAGTGFLTYHLLSRCTPRTLTVNDISSSEMTAAKHLISSSYPDANIDWQLGDMHTIKFNRKFDLIIGNSFIHHFYNVPEVLARFSELLAPKGIFISLHEPTPMSTVVEGGKMFAWPLAVLFPTLVNNIARARFKGQPSTTDLWMFEPKKIRQVALQAGFKSVDTHSWGLFRPVAVYRHNLYTSADRPKLTEDEIKIFRRAIKFDSFITYILPSRCFGSVCLICKKEK